MTSPPDLLNKLSKKIASRRAIQLSAEDLDMLVVSGAYAALARAAVEYQESQCRERTGLWLAPPRDEFEE